MSDETPGSGEHGAPHSSNRPGEWLAGVVRPDDRVVIDERRDDVPDVCGDGEELHQVLLGVALSAEDEDA